MALRCTYYENVARIQEVDNLELWALNEDGESVYPDDGQIIAYWCVFGHVDGEGILDLFDFDNEDEAVKEMAKLGRDHPHLAWEE